MVELFRVVIKQRSDAHIGLRKILSTYLGEPAERIRFEIAPSGKPLHSEIFFSLSHSQNLALIAVSKTQPLGVDIEYVRQVPSMLLIAKRFFSQSEFKRLELLSGTCQESAFFDLWTAKEALTKAKGVRLMDELSHEVLWNQVMPITGLEGYAGHLAFQGCFDPLEPLHVSDFII